MTLITEHGTVTVKVTGAWEINGAVTFENWPGLRPVQRRGGLGHRQQRSGHRHHEPHQAGDDGHPAGHLHVVSRPHSGFTSTGHGRALIGPARLHPNTFRWSLLR